MDTTSFVLGWLIAAVTFLLLWLTSKL